MHAAPSFGECGGPNWYPEPPCVETEPPLPAWVQWFWVAALAAVIAFWH